MKDYFHIYMHEKMQIIYSVYKNGANQFLFIIYIYKYMWGSNTYLNFDLSINIQDFIILLKLCFIVFRYSLNFYYMINMFSTTEAKYIINALPKQTQYTTIYYAIHYCSVVSLECCEAVLLHYIVNVYFQCLQYYTLPVITFCLSLLNAIAGYFVFR